METKAGVQHRASPQSARPPTAPFPSSAANAPPSASSGATSGLLGLSIQPRTAAYVVAPRPIPIHATAAPSAASSGGTGAGAASLPASYTLRPSRPSDSIAGSPSPSRPLSGLEKKKAGGAGASIVASSSPSAASLGMSRRASEVGRLVRKGSNPPAPTLFDFRATDAPSPGPAAPGSLPATSHLPIILQPGDGEDGEILGEEAEQLRAGAGGNGGAAGDDKADGAKGRRRRSANVFRCESCQKIYRHPSCLVKHRWQHSPAWQESSKFLVSKHQQVQMLEAATILVHLQPGSLPEDKSLWPAAISPASHPMPSISFNDSRFISRQGTALSLSQSQRAQQQQQLHQQMDQQRVATGTPGSTAGGTALSTFGSQQGARHPSPEGASNASGEETSAEGGSSPPSSLEEEGPDDDGDLEMDFGEDDVPASTAVSGTASSAPRRPPITRKTRSGKGAFHHPPPVVPPPQLAATRRTSFGAVTAVMGNLALGSSIPKASSPLTQPASFGTQQSQPLFASGNFGPGSYHSGGLVTPSSYANSAVGTPGSFSPHYSALGSFGHNHPGALAAASGPPAFASASLSRSFSGPTSFGAQPSYSPYSTSPALPHPSSSLRGGGGSYSAFDPDDNDDDDGPGFRGRGGGGSSPYPLVGGRFHGVGHVLVEEEDEGEVANAARRPVKEGSGEREDVFSIEDMDL